MKRLLLHICCAPDATVPWPELMAEGYEAVGYFYGSNIHPEEEYSKRAEALKKLEKSVRAHAVFSEYAPDDWLAGTEAFSAEPEGGKRCEVCFRLQLDAAAKYAAENGCQFLSTTLTISPHKNAVLINEIGTTTAAKYGVEWVERIWRKRDGFKRSVEASKRLGLYRQNYCGCVFSRRAEEKLL